MTIGVGFAADRYQTRIKFNLVFLCIGAAGYIILIASRNAALSYFAIYLAASGIFPLIPNTVALVRRYTSSGLSFAYPPSSGREQR